MSRQILISNDREAVSSARNIVNILAENAINYKGKVLYIFLEDGLNEKDRITHDEAYFKAKKLAARLQRHGSKGDRVLLLFPTGIDFAISLFACFLAGMIAVPAYPPHRKKMNQRLRSILEDAEPSIILTAKAIRQDLNEISEDRSETKRISILVYEEVNSMMGDQWTDPDIKPDDIALLQYTSGSTGNPRGVMVSHSNIIHNSECIRRAFGFDEHLRGVNWLPNFHDMGLIGCLIQPAYVGAMNIIIPPLQFLQHPDKWFKSIKKYNATNAGGPNFAYEYCNSKIDDEVMKELDLASVSTMFCGAEPIRRNTLENFSKKFSPAGFNSKQFFPCYGLAESVLIVTGGNYQENPVFLEVDAKSLEAARVLSPLSGSPTRTFTACGFPWNGMSVAIVHPEKLSVLPKGEIGEIWVKGDSVAKGYWNDVQATDYAFKAFIAETNDGPWLRTGDLGFIQEGQLFVSGRLKELIILRGSNYFPADIEFTVENCHAAIRHNSSAAFSVDVSGEEKLVVVAEVNRTYVRDLPEAEINDSVQAAIFAEHGIQPYSINLILTGSILKTTSGKIQRRAIKEHWLKNELKVLSSWMMKEDTAFILSESDFQPESLREWIIYWIAQKLDLDPARIDPDKPVSSYGLDSITAVSLEKDVNEQFGIEWPIESFLKENTINQLVEEGIMLLKQKE
ncbi:MAG: AMP-binding protein [Bacteroidales bacterium]|nr:AMP-binding protein [Bacteroidales bacterium]